MVIFMECALRQVTTPSTNHKPLIESIQWAPVGSGFIMVQIIIHCTVLVNKASVHITTKTQNSI